MKKELLTKKQIKYLSAAFDLIHDEIQNDIITLSKDQKDEDLTWLWAVLPPLGRANLNLALAFKLLTTITTISYKFHTEEKFVLGNLAEEIILHEATNLALSLAEMNHVQINDFEAFIYAVYQDTDFLFLYNPKYDGIELDDVGKLMGITSLSPKDWFNPFNNTQLDSHPFFWESTNKLNFPANNKYDQ